MLDAEGDPDGLFLALLGSNSLSVLCDLSQLPKVQAYQDSSLSTPGVLKFQVHGLWPRKSLTLSFSPDQTTERS